MSESAVSKYEALVGAEPPAEGRILFDTACVLGGSIAGLLTARVLSDHARQVVIVERDEVSTAGRSRPGVPQDQHLHGLLPPITLWIERWLPGLTRELQDLGATAVGNDNVFFAFDGHSLAPNGADRRGLAVGRPLLEARIRARVTALPNVSVLPARAMGLRYDDGAVNAVRYVEDEVEGVLKADFVVDAMGRSSRLSDWVGQDGYDQPRLERLDVPINYATALFERPVKAADLDMATAVAIFSPASDSGGVSAAVANAIEGEQWIVTLAGYGDDRPGTTVDDFRAACAKLPAVFAEATSGVVTRDVATYRLADSRRRHFTGLRHFPARLVSAGDAVASFNPVYGQGMSSAALQASCLSSYLTGDPDLDSAATDFFDLQQLVVDATWTVSAGGDAARLDAMNDVEVPEDVLQQRWAMDQVVGATLVDGSIAWAFSDVQTMLRHPETLADPVLLDRAIAANDAARGV
ncbi:FAD-dependent monooxygenase [Streptomyces olivaceus]|uniref:FAD-dependent monooxygenase n=1 Tax=Streptomyces olivaceus TaxID=47716 RepID=UPI0040565802